MSRALPAGVIEQKFVAACRFELAALKPGNVHVFADGHRMTVRDFELSAEASAPFIAKQDWPPGKRIRAAVDAALRVAGGNTNLGIVLLCVPLAVAATLPGDTSLRARLAIVLSRLDTSDAAETYAAIAAANPAGLGKVANQDVAAAPTVTLREAMQLAADRDRIARAYVTDFADVFELGLPALQAARRQASDPLFAITTLHMTYLAAFPDSHIARKHGPAAAAEVVAEAEALKRIWYPTSNAETLAELLAFDASLKARGLNPGTTADLVVATLFADALQQENKPVSGG